MISQEHGNAAVGDRDRTEILNNQFVLPILEEVVLIGMATEKAIPKVEGFRCSKLKLYYCPIKPETAQFVLGESDDIFNINSGEVGLLIDCPALPIGRRQLSLQSGIQTDKTFYTYSSSTFDVETKVDGDLGSLPEVNHRGGQIQTLNGQDQEGYFPDLKEAFTFTFSDEEYERFQEAYDELKGSEEVKAVVKQVIELDEEHFDLSDILNGVDGDLIRHRAQQNCC